MGIMRPDLGEFAIEAIDQLIDAYEEAEDARVEQAIMVFQISEVDPDPEPDALAPPDGTAPRRHSPFIYSTSRDPFAQIGLLRMGLRTAEDD
jgi:hypothetical protein